MTWPVNPLRGKTTDWRAVCGKSACTVRRGEGPNSIGPSYPYLSCRVYSTACSRRRVIHRCHKRLMPSKNSPGLHCRGNAVAQRGEFLGTRGNLAEGGFRDSVLAVWQGVDSLIDEVEDAVNGLDHVSVDRLDLLPHIERRQGRIQVNRRFHKSVAIAWIPREGWAVNPIERLGGPAHGDLDAIDK